MEPERGTSEPPPPPPSYSLTDLTRRFRQCSHPTPTAATDTLAALADAALSYIFDATFIIGTEQ